MDAFAVRTHRIVESPAFHILVFFVILASSVLLGVETYPDVVARHPLFFHLVNLGILSFFVVEIGLRILAYGQRPLRFFADGWNMFDFAIVVLLLLPIHAEYFAILRLARIFRILRVLKAVRLLLLVEVLQLQFFVSSFVRSLAPMGSIAVLLSLHVYIYAIIGTFLFHEIDPVHFGTLHHSILTLLTVVTRDKSNLLQILTTPNTAGQSESVLVAAIYSISFILIGAKVVLNMIIGAIVKSIHETQEEEKEEALLRQRKNRKLTTTQELTLIEADLQETALLVRMLKRSLRDEGMKKKRA